MKRGEIYTFMGKGDFSGKPRPGLIVQSDLFNEYHLSVTVCPITSELTGNHLFRILVEPNEGNGLELESEIEIDKLQSVRTDRIDRFVGVLADEHLLVVDEALRLWLDL
ncbi:MAG: type II toxin-antitoxin system PemK/MazF family toxin [Novosphingobium sp.]